MKQITRISYILCILFISLCAQDKRPLAFKQIDLWSRIKQSFSLFFRRDSQPKTIGNLEAVDPIEIDKAIANKKFPGWRIADQEIQTYVHQITQDPSLIVIQARINPFSPGGAIQSSYTNNKYIFLDPLTIKSLKSKNHKLLSWKEFKQLNTPTLLKRIFNFLFVEPLLPLIGPRYTYLAKLHPFEIKALILHEYAHLQHNDTEKQANLDRLLQESKIIKSQYNEQMKKHESDADALVVNSNDIQVLMGQESLMLKVHLYKKFYGIKDPDHPYPLLRAWQAEDKINKMIRLSPEE